MLQTDVDGQEVRAPQHGDEGGEQAVAERHAPTVATRYPEDQRTHTTPLDVPALAADDDVVVTHRDERTAAVLDALRAEAGSVIRARA